MLDGENAVGWALQNVNEIQEFRSQNSQLEEIALIRRELVALKAKWGLRCISKSELERKFDGHC